MLKLEVASPFAYFHFDLLQIENSGFSEAFSLLSYISLVKSSHSICFSNQLILKLHITFEHLVLIARLYEIKNSYDFFDTIIENLQQQWNEYYLKRQKYHCYHANLHDETCLDFFHSKGGYFMRI